MPKNKEPSAIKGFFSGGFGGMCLVFAGHPLDLIKVRLQTMVTTPGVAPPYTGALDCARKTVAAEGFMGLYKGMAAPLAGVTPIFAVNFLAYDAAVKAERRMLGVAPDEDCKLWHFGVAGAFAAIPTTAIMAPGERIKCILQTQDTMAGGPKYAGPMDVVKDLYAEGGFRSLYRGAAATLARDASGSVLYFSVYEAIKRALSSRSGDGELNPLAVVMAGGMAGVANWSVAIPFDTVKSRIQTFPAGSYKGMVDCASKMVAEEGYSTLFRGLGPAMLRAFPANAACFMGREVALKFLDWLAPDF